MKVNQQPIFDYGIGSVAPFLLLFARLFFLQISKAWASSTKYGMSPIMNYQEVIILDYLGSKSMNKNR